MESNIDTELTARETALELLNRIEEEGGFSDKLLSSQQVFSLESRDRAFVRELVLGTARWQFRFDRIIDTYYTKRMPLKKDIRNILRLGIFQIMFMDSVPDHAAVNESVELASQKYGKGGGGLVNAILRRYLREGEPEFPEDPVRKLSIEYSHPFWMVARWESFYGMDTAEMICRAGNSKRPLFMRANTIKNADLQATLSEEGFEPFAVEGMDGWFYLEKGEGLFQSKAFKEGLFTVQDPGAGVAMELLSPRPGEKVADLCAAPGGKATGIADKMKDQGTIEAVDINRSKLSMIDETAGRLGLSSIKTIKGDVLVYGDEGVYDRVLLDAPCSGTGVLSKRPEIRWRLSIEDINRLAELQKKMLENAARILKPGGVLVYSTCSLEPEENEGIIKEFLDSHSDFELVRDSRFSQYEREYGYLVFPHMLHGGGGAFASGLERR